jgi:hypothetical protein
MIIIKSNPWGPPLFFCLFFPWDYFFKKVLGQGLLFTIAKGKRQSKAKEKVPRKGNQF